MQQLWGTVRSYAWGSRTAIAELTGRPVPTARPEAELWLGAHPASPSSVCAPGVHTSLLDIIERDPRAQLGPDCRARFGDRLPFLLKVLAAEEPLSLQAHPSAQQAQQGYAAEQRRQIPLDSPERSYRDRHHKPELVCALTSFDALVGFRPIDHTIALLRAINCPALRQYVDLLTAQPNADGLRALFTTWITLPAAPLRALLPAVLAGCTQLARVGGEFAAEARTVAELGRRYPGDVGVLGSLLMNRITLKPGEALYLAAGNLHAYLGGVAVELMANSDNVLRGGLTRKHVDVPELLRVLDFVARDVAVLHGDQVGGERVYRTSASEFRLSRLALPAGAAATVAHQGPQILLCTAGTAELQCGGAELRVNQGEAVWSPADDLDVQMVAGSAGAEIFRARDGLDEC